MSGCCLYLFAFAPPHYAIPILFFIAIVLSILIGVDKFTSGRKRNVKAAIPRVQSVCDDMRRKLSSDGSDTGAAQEANQLYEVGVPK